MSLHEHIQLPTIRIYGKKAMVKCYMIYVYLDCDITYYLFIRLTYFYKLIVLNVQTNVHEYSYIFILYNKGRFP